MSLNEEKTQIICKLEKAIVSGKRIILFNCDNNTILNTILNKIEVDKIENVEIWVKKEYYSKSKIVKVITDEEIFDLLKLYKMYEFSNRFYVVSDSEQYGNVFNYIRNGIITEEEMADALFIDILF